MTTLLEMQNKVRNVLSPRTDDKTWPPQLIEAALRRALNTYEMYGPVIEADFTVSTAGTEQALSEGAGGIDDIFAIDAVCYPWDPTEVFFTQMVDFRTTDFQGHKIIMERKVKLYTPAAGETIRVRYHQIQQIQGLDGATSTSFPDHYDKHFAIGAAGYACDQRALDLGEDPAAAAGAVETLDRRAQGYLGEFSGFLGMGASKALQSPRWAQAGMERNIGLLVAGRRR